MKMRFEHPSSVGPSSLSGISSISKTSMKGMKSSPSTSGESVNNNLIMLFSGTCNLGARALLVKPSEGSLVKVL